MSRNLYRKDLKQNNFYKEPEMQAVLRRNLRATNQTISHNCKVYFDTAPKRSENGFSSNTGALNPEGLKGAADGRNLPILNRYSFLIAFAALAIVFSVLPSITSAADALPGSGSLADLLDNGLNPWSDITTAGLSIAERRAYLQAFAELRRERSFYDRDRSETPSGSGTVQGQVPCASSTFWFNPIGRGGEYAAALPVSNYELQSYGFQAGSTLKSTPTDSIGLLLGYQRGWFRNNYNPGDVLNPLLPADGKRNFRTEKNAIRFDDYYLGLYYGHSFWDGYEFRAYVGGGHQRYKLSRNDQLQSYTTNYEGASFELNLEIAKYFTLCKNAVLRPYIGFDIEYARQESALEPTTGSWFRYYDRADFTQLFVRFGADLEKRWSRVDLYGGLAYSCMFGDNRRAETSIYYPDQDFEIRSKGARLGRSCWTLRTGVNLPLNAARTNLIFLDYTADIFTDRAADTALHTGSVGFSSRF